MPLAKDIYFPYAFLSMVRQKTQYFPITFILQFRKDLSFLGHMISWSRNSFIISSLVVHNLQEYLVKFGTLIEGSEIMRVFLDIIIIKNFLQSYYRFPHLPCSDFSPYPKFWDKQEKQYAF